MNAKDQFKVINSGFTIIRREGEQTFAGKKIKFKNKDKHEWATLHKDFKSNSEMDRMMKKLLALSTIIED